jgi:hypothetical protein
VLRPSLLLAWLIAILGILAPSIASAATTANLQTRVKAFELVVPTLIGRSTARTPEKHPKKSNAYDGIASGSPLAAEGGAGASRGMTTLYRAVSEAELADVGASGALRAGPGSMGNKLFAESAGNAGSWGRMFFRMDKQRFVILRARVPNFVAGQMQRWQMLDGIGPARSAEGPVLDLINQHGVFDVLGANPLF